MNDTKIEELWFDTHDGLARALESGLAGLHEIAASRSKYSYGERAKTPPGFGNLRSWCLLGRWVLDPCGNTMIIIEGAPADHSSYEVRKRVRPVMTAEEAYELAHNMTSTHAGLPATAQRCDRCLDGWELANAHDVRWDRENKQPRHRLCDDLAVIQDTMAQIREILAAAGIEGSVLFVPNRYWPPSPRYDEVRTPWAIVQSSKGCIRIGARKRVIQIEWAFGENDFTMTGADVAAGDKTTTGATLIHAWGTDKAVEYLRRLWNA